MSATRNLKLLKLFYAFRSLIFVLPVLTIYYAQEKGVGIGGIFWAEAAFSLGIVLMIVPAGYLSDRWQRKYTLALGGFIAGLGFAIEWLGYGLTQMMIAEFVVGIGFALSDNSIRAMTYDTMLTHGEEKNHQKEASNLHMVQTISGVLAGVIGAYMFKWDANLPIIMCVVMSACAGATAFLMEEPKLHRDEEVKNPFKDMLETCKYALHGHKEVACIILLVVVVLNATRLGFWMHQPYYMAVNVPVEWFGWLSAIGALFATLGAQAAKVEERIKPVFSVLLLILMPIVCYGGAALVGNMFGLIFIALVPLVYGYATPVTGHAINSRVESRRRATILGAKGLVSNLVFILTASLAGWISETHGVFTAMLILSAVLASTGFVAYACLKKHEVI